MSSKNPNKKRDDFFSNLSNPQHLMSMNRIEPKTPNQAKMFELFGAGHDIFVHGFAGTGKRISNDELILTNGGWKRVGDVSLDDMLVAPDGTFTAIEGIFPQETGKLYKVNFEDGCSLIVDGDHLWAVRNGKNGYRYKNEFVIKTTQEIIDSKGPWYIPLTDPVPGNLWTGYDPYILGLLLGDGTLAGAHPTIYNTDKEIVDYLTSRGWKSYVYEYSTTTMLQATNVQTTSGIEVLKHYIGAEKRIPDCLLYADPETRLALLQGLMDSDGSVCKDGSARFNSISKYLAEGVQYLVRSLGGKSKLTMKRRPSLKGGREEIWNVTVLYGEKFSPFRLSRKKVRLKKQRGRYRKIIDIIPVSDGPATCFRVEHPSHLFVCQDFIVTHNTLLSLYLGLSDILSSDNVRDSVTIIRSVVPSRDMGFLPGSAKEKARVYEIPYQDACGNLFPSNTNASNVYDSLKANKVLNFTTTSFLRGQTFKNTVVYIDEIQNMCDNEIHTIMTRIGDNCRVIVSGDIRQTDLLREGEKLGCATFIKVLDRMPTFQKIEFGVEDILRSSFVKDYIIARAEVMDGLTSCNNKATPSQS